MEQLIERPKHSKKPKAASKKSAVPRPIADAAIEQLAFPDASDPELLSNPWSTHAPALPIEPSQPETQRQLHELQPQSASAPVITPTVSTSVFDAFDVADTNALWDDLHRKDDLLLAESLKAVSLYPDTNISTDAAATHHLLATTDPSAPPLIAHPLPATPFEPSLYPSAPTIMPESYVVSENNSQTMEQSSTITKLHTLDPLPQESWRAVFKSDLAAEHLAIVQDFRARNNNLGPSDAFYEKLLLYETAFKNTIYVRSQLNAARTAAKNLSGRLWTLSRSPKQASSSCSDGRVVSHNYADELAIYNTQIEHELVNVWSDIRRLYHVHLSKVNFEAKMSKIWIQNSLDTFISKQFQPSLELAQSKPFAFDPAWEFDAYVTQDLRKLLHYLDVLFAFERRNNMTEASSPLSNDPASPPTATARSQKPSTPLSGSGSGSGSGSVTQQSAGEPSIFVKDVRNWITYIAAILIRSGGPIVHREILLHLLRCPNIGSWGAHFIQWPIPSNWSEAFANHFLTSLRIFLGPVEEVEEAEVHRASEVAFTRANLKRLESEDEWIVVDENLFIPPSPRYVVCLSENDYLHLFRQFNLAALFESLVFQCVNDAASSSARSTTTSTAHRFALLFAFANETLDLLKRSITCIPNVYRNFHSKVAHTVVSIACTMAKHLRTPDASDSLDASVLQAHHLPAQIMIYCPHAVRTTLHVEISAFVMRLTRIILSSGSVGIWDCLLSLPIQDLPSSTRHDIFRMAINGDMYKLDDPTDPQHQSLSLVLLSNQNQAAIILQFLVKLVSESHSNRNPPEEWPSSIENPLLASDVVLLVQTMFDHCLLQLDVQATLLQAVADNLCVLSKRFPFAISHILKITWSEFSKLEYAAESLFLKLPLELWPVESDDMETLQGLLNDPIASPRFRFAQSIVSRLNWTASTSNGVMLVAPRYQRALAIHLCHRVLDRQSTKDNQSGIVSAASAATFATAEIVTKQVLPSTVSTYLFSDPDKDFESWCWNTVLKLAIYQKPSSHSAYSISAFEHAFESLDNPSIATLNAHADTSALAAYIVLYVSEVGYHYRQFQARGWSLLETIATKGPLSAFLCASQTILYTFSVELGIDMFDDPGFANLFKQIYRTKIILDGVSLRDPGNEIGRTIISSIRTGADLTTPNPDAQFTASFWLRSVFVDKDWPTNPTALAVLDGLCESYLSKQRIELLHSLLVREYNALLSVYQASRAKSFKFSYTRPMESIYSLASTIEYLGSTFPTLVPPPPAAASLKGTLEHLISSEKSQFVWFVYEALTVESLSEREMIRRIARALSADSQISAQQILNSRDTVGFDKPLESFAIFRWAACILYQVPLDHPLMPLFWQAFFSLYFDRIDPPPHSSFGHRFLSSSSQNGQLVQQLKTMLAKLCSKFEMSPMHANIELVRLYRAMTLWLSEPRLLTDPSVFTTQEAYQIDRLRECNLFTGEPNQLWLWLSSSATPRVTRIASFSSSSQSSSVNEVADRRLLASTSSTPVQATTVVSSSVHLAPAVAPPARFRTPVVPLSDTLTPEQIVDIFKHDLQTVMEASRASKAVVDRLTSGHQACLDNLRHLYTIHKRRQDIERGCGSRCAGHAIIQCDIQEAIPNIDLRNIASEHAQQAELILMTDYVDSKLCISGLRILSAVDSLVRTNTKSNVQLDGIFFDTLHVLSEAAPFAPSTFLSDIMVRQLGSSVISLSEQQTHRIVQLLEHHENVSLLSKIFDPHRSPESFAEFYARLARVLNDDEIPVQKTVGPELLALDNIERIGLVVETGCLIVCSTPMFDVQSDIHFVEICDVARSVFVPWMLLRPSSSSKPSTPTSSHASLKSAKYAPQLPTAWREEQTPLIDLIVSMHIKTLYKICAVYHRIDKLAYLIWNLHADFVEARCNAPFLSCVQRLAFDPIVTWSTFEITASVIDRVSVWISNALFSNSAIKFFVDVAGSSMGVSSPGSGIDAFEVWRVVLYIVHKIDSVWSAVSDRRMVFDMLQKAFVAKQGVGAYPADIFERLVVQLPLEWTEQASSTLMHDTSAMSCPSLTLCLALLRQIGGFNDQSGPYARSNLRFYTNYICSLVDKQIKADQLLPMLRMDRPSFIPEAIGQVISETLMVAEMIGAKQDPTQTMPGNLAGAYDPENSANKPLMYTIQSTLSLFNVCPRDSKYFPRLWDGIVNATRVTQLPLVYLAANCLSMSSVEHMALLSEHCITWHMTRAGDPQQWTVVVEILQIPELEESTFLRHCLNNALILTLYTHARKRVSAAQGNVDLEVTMGEQVGVWIESLRIEHVERGQECKALLLLMLFGDLLKLELTSLLLPENHSRLRAHLPLISDALFRWSEDRSSQGIWATLGFGPVSRLTVEFRFITRVIALFITLRLIDPDAEEQRAKLMDAFAKMRQGSGTSEYQKINATGSIDDAAALLVDLEHYRLDALAGIIDKFARRLFGDSWTTLCLSR
eukprot:jgi/Hompol1/4006/HPOL_003430-RA